MPYDRKESARLPDLDFATFHNVRVGAKVSTYLLNSGLVVPAPSPIVATFQLNPATNGIANLPANITINSTEVAPTFIYYGGDATTTIWPAQIGSQLAIISTGAEVTPNNGSPLLGTDDDSAKFNGGKFFELNGSNAYADVGTDDLWISALFKFNGVAERIMGKRNGDNSRIWELETTTTTVFGRFYGAGGTNPSVPTDTLTVGCWYFLELAFDASGSARMYVNGVQSASDVDVSDTGDMDSVGDFGIGGRENASAKFTSNIAYLGLWHGSGWLDSHDQDTLAAERFQQLTGFWPTLAEGTPAPALSTRAFAAYLDKYENSDWKLFQVGAEWLRCCDRKDSSGVNVKGYLPELAAENIILQSETLGVTWSPTRATVDANATTAPNGMTTADGLDEDGTASNTHFIQQTTITLTDGVKYVFSVFVAPINRYWFQLVVNHGITSLANFDTVNGLVGTTANIDASGVHGPFLGGFYRCWFAFTGSGTGARSVSLYIGEGDNDVSFSGGSQPSLYVWGAQLEVGYVPSSYIPTAAAARTRVKDELRYKGDDGNLGGVGSDGQGAFVVDVLYPDHDVVSSFYTLSINDGGSIDDRIDLWVNATGDAPVIDTRADGGNPGDIDGSTDVADNTKHTIRLSWQTDNLELFVDGASEGTDTAADIPDGLDRIDIGVDHAGTNMFGGLIQNIRIYDDPEGGE